jgi:hypothetical protein
LPLHWHSEQFKLHSPKALAAEQEEPAVVARELGPVQAARAVQVLEAVVMRIPIVVLKGLEARRAHATQRLRVRQGCRRKRTVVKTLTMRSIAVRIRSGRGTSST